MNITIIGGASFIGTNLAIMLSKNNENRITIIDRDIKFFPPFDLFHLNNVSYQVHPYTLDTNFDLQVVNQDIVFHLASTTIPGNSNRNISMEVEDNVIVTIKLLDACVRQKVTKVVFLSSGGAVYGNKADKSMKEDMNTFPITSYGIQKIMIEKLLYLYHYQYGLDYRVIRLSNPYGPYQRPNGKQGVITTFIYKALTDGILEVYGDGSIVRDFIYISDAITGIINIVNGNCKYRIFNLGSGKGISINEVISSIKNIIQRELQIIYTVGRDTDVPVNYLDISRYENEFGKLHLTCLKSGIKKTANFLMNEYRINNVIV